MRSVRIAPATARYLSRALEASSQPGPLSALSEKFQSVADAGERSVELNDIEAAYTARMIDRELLPRATDVTRIVFEKLLARLDGHTPTREKGAST
jgi:hypothetical protein